LAQASRRRFPNLDLAIRPPRHSPLVLTSSLRETALVVRRAGTMGLEIVEQVPDVDAVVVPVGGAGLIAGIALAIKTLRPHCQVIGVEPSHVASLTAALEAGHPETIVPGPTLADGLNVPRVGANAFEWPGRAWTAW